jgi:spermidine/putrescine transport system substrate-binding protein
MAIVYNGDAIRGVADDPDTEYFVPDEGGVLWVDNLAIPAKAPHRDTAEQFINFLLDPKVGAQLSNFNQYATPNKAARAFINPDDLANPAIYPPAELMAKMEFVVDVGDANRLYDEVWTQVRSE